MIAARSHRTRGPVQPRPVEKRADVVPYDYGATFRVIGRPGNVVQSVINTAPDSLFVAVAIGYGFEEDRSRAIAFDNSKPAAQAGTLPTGIALPTGMVLLGDMTLGDLPASALIEGFRVDPRFDSQVFASNSTTDRKFSDDPVPIFQVQNGLFFQQLRPPAQITFLFSMLDSGTGRELQDEPVHNIASLGKSDGERPFRLLAQPITFLPRTTMRLQIIERSQDVRGTLFIVFYGYQVVGASCCPELIMRRLTGPPACPVETIGNPSARVIPFDYVATFTLTGRPQNQLENEIVVNAEGGFVASSIGYGLLVEESGVALQWPRASDVQDNTLKNQLKTIAAARQVWLQALAKKTGPPPPAPSIDLARVPLRLFASSALSDGIRIRPDRLRLAFQDNGALANNLRIDLADDLFERLNRPDDVSFRYSIFDSGRGQDLQNIPLNNISGLGSADGDRPFKRLARSIIFQPRSTIRVRVEERFGRGTLFIVLQGYKVLGAGGAR
jgi:hypothetical protein